MLLFLLSYLSGLGFKIPAAFNYASTRMMLAALTGLLVTIFLGPRCIKKLYEMKTGQSIRVEDCPMLAQLHEKKKNTPTMGGILILGSMLLALFLWMDLKSSFTLILGVITLFLGCVGGADDYLKLKFKNSKGLKSRTKMILQLVIASIVALYLLLPSFSSSVQQGSWFHPPEAKEQIEEVKSSKGTPLSLNEYMVQYYVPFVKRPLFICSVGIAFFISIFVMTGSSNAVNLSDGLDGLAAGCVVMTAGVLSLVAFLSNNLEIARHLNILYIEGAGEIAVYLAAMMGACLGFLWYNGFPAQVFMGDTGSLALGGILGVAAILLRREFLLALAGGIFVAEALSVILQVGSYKLRDKKRIFLCAPLHHHFEYLGWPETKVVVRFWIIGLILAVISIISLKLQ